MSLFVRDVTVAYDGKLVLDHLTFTVPEEGVTVLFGPSGSGKTTLLDVLSGLLVPASGTVSVPGVISRVFQDNRLIGWASAAENLSCVLSRLALERVAADKGLTDGLLGGAAPGDGAPLVSAALEAVGLSGEADSLPDELSGGMQKRLGLARALIYDGDAIVLDEPTAGLDERSAIELLDRLMRLWRRKPVLLVTHERTLAERYGDNIVEVTGPPLAVFSP